LLEHLGLPPRPSVRFTAGGVAAVHCPVACRVELKASRAGQHVGAQRTLGARGSVTVRLDARALKDLGHGRAKLTVEVDGVVVGARTLSV
jgi:hypothetical protein